MSDDSDTMSLNEDSYDSSSDEEESASDKAARKKEKRLLSLLKAYEDEILKAIARSTCSSFTERLETMRRLLRQFVFDLLKKQDPLFPISFSDEQNILRRAERDAIRRNERNAIRRNEE